ncbi:MAG TPA: CotH kinase family protein, partial [Saprospiraceae bacterium]|nr:CotH kinase family protein [Saprospiraceae bacterium]
FQEGVVSLKLSNMLFDPSFIREVLGYYMANQFLISPKANFCRLYVNGKYLGIYTSAESVDTRFLKKHFGNNKGVLIKCDPTWALKESKTCPKGDNAALLYQGEDSTCYRKNYELKSDYGYKELIKLIRTLNQEPDKIASLLDIDKTLWMHAFNHTIVNLDSYSGTLSHNYYLYKDSTGLFVPLIWDLNLSFGAFTKDYKKNLTDADLFNYSVTEHYNDPTRPLIQKLLEKPVYRKIYLAHVRYIYEHLFKNNSLLTKADEYHQFIDAEVKKDLNKLYTYEDFNQNLEQKVMLGTVPVVGLKEFITERTNYLGKTEISGPGPLLTEPQLTKDAQNFTISVNCTGADKVYLFYKNKQQPYFSYVLMQTVDNEPSTIVEKNYTKQLPLKDETYYYIVAENSKTATVIPELASNKAIKVQ